MASAWLSQCLSCFGDEDTLAEVKQWRNDEHVENRQVFIASGDGLDSVYVILRAAAEIMIHFSHLDSDSSDLNLLTLVFIVPPPNFAWINMNQ